MAIWKAVVVAIVMVYLAENEPWPTFIDMVDLHVNLGRLYGEWAWVGRVM